MSGPEAPGARYVVITPARNEAQFIEHTLQSMLAQTLTPSLWIIVDDGSTDGTDALVARYAAQCHWIRLVQVSSQREQRSGGSKVVRAFNAGYAFAKDEPFEFIVKLDADLTLPPDYFEAVSRCFAEHPRVGLCGGYCVVEQDGALVPESYTTDHVRGALKAYRRESFAAIGGLMEVWSWDGLDEAALAWRGWQFTVLPLPVVHHRPTSKEYNLLWHSWRTGREMFKERVDPLSLMIVAAVHLGRKPVIVGSALFVLGYLASWVRREAPVVSEDLARFIRQDRFKKVTGKVRRLLCGRRSEARSQG